MFSKLLEGTPKITDPTAIFVFLVALIGFVFFISDKKYAKPVFNILPFVFWIYFLPMIATTFNIIPAKSALYTWAGNNILPACLILLLLSVDLPSIMKLGPKTLFVMLAGSFGIVIGAPIAYLIFKSHLPADAWKGIASLSGSWIGGGANMTAITESFETPGSVLAPVIIVDVVLAYGWMGIVIYLSKFQRGFDKWNNADTRIVENVNKKMKELEESNAKPTTTPHLLMMLGLAFAIGYLSLKFGYFVSDLVKSAVSGMNPKIASSIKAVTSGKTIMVILVTFIGIGLSFTKANKLENYGASKVGYVLLYILLATIGAKANLMDIKEAPYFMALGFVWLLIHASCLLLAVKLVKAPMFFGATASQANIGGPVSAPIVAAVYQPSLATVGLLMGIVGSIIGTFLGLLVGIICKLIAGV